MPDFFTDFMTNFMIVTGVHVLGLMSPGPDFAMITKMTLTYGRRTGIFTAVGLMCGVMVHITYCIIGIGFIIAQSIIVFNVIKYVGAGYLVYIGIRALLTKKLQSPDSNSEALVEVKTISPHRAIMTGFMTNVLNPKATLFFFSIFTQVVNPNTPLATQGVYAIMMLATTVGWFSLVATIFSHHRIQSRMHKIKHHIERSMGVVLIALGIKIILPESK